MAAPSSVSSSDAAGDAPAAARNRFLLRNPEKADFNQYWYSVQTINTIVEEVCESSERCAFLSTPSIYFSMPKDRRAQCKVFDFDTKWESDPGFVHYDFNKAEELPEDCLHAFDMVVIDPPFITEEVWEQYATSARLLLPEAVGDSGAVVGGRVILTTVAENADMIKRLLGADPVQFRPSIPQLVYQYSMYTNYEAPHLANLNPEVDTEAWGDGNG